MEDQNQAIRSFCELTETNEEIATSYLERVDYRIEAAIEHYYLESAVKGEETTNEKAMQKRKKEEEEERTKTVMCEWCCIDLDETASIYCTRDESEEERGRNRERHFYCLECGASAAERNGGRCGENGCTHRLIRAQFGLPIAHNDHMEVPQSEESRVEGIDRRKRQKRVNDDEEEPSPDEVEEEEEKEGEEEEKEEEEESEEEDEELEEYFVYYRRPSPDDTEEEGEKEGEEEDVCKYQSMQDVGSPDSSEQQLKQQSATPADEVVVYSLFSNQMPANEDRPVGGISSSTSADESSIALPSNTSASNQTTIPEQEGTSWDSLPWTVKKRLFFHLRTDEDCTDLANLAQVSPNFNNGVHEFMMIDGNQPGIRELCLERDTRNFGPHRVYISLYPSNLPFHSLASLDAGRFERLGDSVDPRLKVTLNGPEDPVIEQVSSLLSSYIKRTDIEERSFYSGVDFQLCSNLLHNSTFSDLRIEISTLDDTVGPHILSLVSRTKNIVLQCSWVELSDPAGFITQLASDVSHAILRNEKYVFFGLSRSFWNDFLNEKLANGSFEFVATTTDADIPGLHPREIINAPFFPADGDPCFIECLEWQKKE